MLLLFRDRELDINFNILRSFGSASLRLKKSHVKMNMFRSLLHQDDIVVIDDVGGAAKLQYRPVHGTLNGPLDVATGVLPLII